MSTPTTPEDDLDDIFRRNIEEPPIEFNPEAWQAMEKKLDGANAERRAFWRRFYILGMLGIFLVGGTLWYDLGPKPSVTTTEQGSEGNSNAQLVDKTVNGNKVQTPIAMTETEVGSRAENSLTNDSARLLDSTQPVSNAKISEEEWDATGEKLTLNHEKEEQKNKNLKKRVADQVSSVELPVGSAVASERGPVAVSVKPEASKRRPDGKQGVTPAQQEQPEIRPFHDVQQPVVTERLSANKKQGAKRWVPLAKQTEKNLSPKKTAELARKPTTDEKSTNEPVAVSDINSSSKQTKREKRLIEKSANYRSGNKPEKKAENAFLHSKKQSNNADLSAAPTAEEAKNREVVPKSSGLTQKEAADSTTEEMQPLLPHYLANSRFADMVSEPSAEKANRLEKILDSTSAAKAALDSLLKPVVADTSTPLRLAVPRRRARWSMTLLASPDFSVVGKLSAPGFATGLAINYQLSRRWSVSAGALYADKIYSARPDQYTVAPGYWGRWTPEKIDGTCKVLDLPISLRYDLMSTSYLKYYVVVGISSYLMLWEKYSYEYTYYGKKQEKSWSVSNENKHFLKVVNFSFGYERKLNHRFSYQVEPYIKVPLVGVGVGKVKLFSGGAFLSLKYHFGKE